MAARSVAVVTGKLYSVMTTEHLHDSAIVDFYREAEADRGWTFPWAQRPGAYHRLRRPDRAARRDCRRRSPARQ